MTNFHDAWFLLQHSAYPVASGVVFFLLGLWFAYLLWHRWVRHLHVLKRENQELRRQIADIELASEPATSEPLPDAESELDPEPETTQGQP